MKKTLYVILFFCIVSVSIISINLFAQGNSNKAEVSFTYTSQKGFSSNQFAVWIEDRDGRYVKTLYATRFTANGGWKKRDQSIPLWVKQSNLAAMNNNQIDALTGPTPKSGRLSYIWDGTDSSGKAVSAGEYRVLVEATLRGENRVLYTAVIKLGERGQTDALAQYFGNSTAERAMIGPVTVTY